MITATSFKQSQSQSQSQSRSGQQVPSSRWITFRSSSVPRTGPSAWSTASASKSAAGGAVGIVGESGSGKSITSLATMGLIPMPPGRIAEGRVELEGVNLLELPTLENAGDPRP